MKGFQIPDKNRPGQYVGLFVYPSDGTLVEQPHLEAVKLKIQQIIALHEPTLVSFSSLLHSKDHGIINFTDNIDVPVEATVEKVKIESDIESQGNTKPDVIFNVDPEVEIEFKNRKKLE